MVSLYGEIKSYIARLKQIVIKVCDMNLQQSKT